MTNKELASELHEYCNAHICQNCPIESFGGFYDCPLGEIAHTIFNDKKEYSEGKIIIDAKEKYDGHRFI